MRKVNILLMITAALMLSLPVSAATIVYWDFDDPGAGDDVTMPGNGERADLDADGAMDTDDFRISAIDKSGNSNHLTAWTSNWMDWDADSSMGDYSMRQTDNWSNYWPAAGTDSEYNPDIQAAGYNGVDAEPWEPAQWTVEAVFKSTDVSGNRTFVGRDGMHSNLASMYFCTRGTDLSIEYMDVDGNWHVNRVAAGIQTNVWYHAAGVSDGSTLKLYLDGNLIGTLDLTLSGSADTALTSDIDANGDYYAWTVSRGMWGANDIRPSDHTDRYFGYVDFVAISDTALAPGSFAYETGPVGGGNAYGGYATPENDDGTVGTLVGTSPNYDAEVTLHFKAGKDPNSTTGYPVYPQIVRHYVYISASPTDPNLVYDGYVDQVHNADPNLTDPNNTYGPLTLDDNAVYYWAVEEALNKGAGVPYGVGDPNNIMGSTWSFTTVAATPTITTQPRPCVADPNATFSIVASSTATHYQWFQVDTPTDIKLTDAGIFSGTKTDTLVVTLPTIANEAAFYCIAYNGDPEGVDPYVASDPSDEVWMVLKRMTGYWKLDGDMTDSIATEEPGAVPHNGFMNNGDPNYLDEPNSLSGTAMRFFNDGEFMELPEAGFFNYYEDGFTTSYWYKQYSNVGWRLPMSKFDIGQAGWLFGIDANPYYTFIIESPWGGSYGASTPNVNDGSWHLFTITYDPADNTVRLYTDGLEQDSDVRYLATAPLPSRPIQIGGDDADGTPGCIDAGIDEVRMYSYPLTAKEVAQLYVDHVDDVYLCVIPENSEIETYDLDGDCRVTLADFAMVASQWLECQRIPVDTCTW